MEIIVRKPTDEEVAHMLTCPTWGCDVSKFEWSYTSEERCLIIEGEVTIVADGMEVYFKEGDYVVFPNGLQCTWNVTKKVKKYYEFK